MARLGSWDLTGYPPTWFDVDNNIGGVWDRDAIPIPGAPPPPPPPPFLIGSSGNAQYLDKLYRDEVDAKRKLESDRALRALEEIYRIERVQREAQQGRQTMAAQLLAMLQAAASVGPPPPPAPPPRPLVSDSAGELPPGAAGLPAVEKLALGAALLLAAAPKLDGTKPGKTKARKTAGATAGPTAPQKTEDLARRGWIKVAASVAEALYENGSVLVALGPDLVEARISKAEGGWQKASEGKSRFYAFVHPVTDKTLLKISARLSGAGAQAVAMASFGWVKVTQALAEHLYAHTRVAMLGDRDKARKDPKVHDSAQIGWEIACQLEEAARSLETCGPRGWTWPSAFVDTTAGRRQVRSGFSGEKARLSFYVRACQPS